MLKTIFAQKTAEAAHEQWRHVADEMRERYEKLAVMMDGSREEVLAYVAFPKEHRPQISSTNPWPASRERLMRRKYERATVANIVIAPGRATISWIVWQV